MRAGTLYLSAESGSGGDASWVTVRNSREQKAHGRSMSSWVRDVVDIAPACVRVSGARRGRGPGAHNMEGDSHMVYFSFYYRLRYARTLMVGMAKLAAKGKQTMPESISRSEPRPENKKQAGKALNNPKIIARVTI